MTEGRRGLFATETTLPPRMQSRLMLCMDRQVSDRATAEQIVGFAWTILTAEPTRIAVRVTTA